MKILLFFGLVAIIYLQTILRKWTDDAYRSAPVKQTVDDCCIYRKQSQLHFISSSWQVADGGDCDTAMKKMTTWITEQR